MNATQFIVKYFWWAYRPLKSYLKTCSHRADAARLYNMPSASMRVFYLGITNHPNLGDMGQHYCIKKWIGENYPHAKLEMFEADTIVNTKSGFLKIFKNSFKTHNTAIPK